MLFFMVAFPFFYFRAVKNVTWEKTVFELLPKRLAWGKEIAGAIVLLVALFAAFLVLSTILSFAGLNDLNNVNDVVNGEIQNNALVFAVTIAVVVFIEEFFFRGFLQKRIGILPSTAVFTILHIGYGSIAEIIGVFALGLILAYWYKKHNSLFQNYLGHLLYNIIAILIYFAL